MADEKKSEWRIEQNDSDGSWDVFDGRSKRFRSYRNTERMAADFALYLSEHDIAEEATPEKARPTQAREALATAEAENKRLADEKCIGGEGVVHRLHVRIGNLKRHLDVANRALTTAEAESEDRRMKLVEMARLYDRLRTERDKLADELRSQGEEHLLNIHDNKRLRDDLDKLREVVEINRQRAASIQQWAMGLHRHLREAKVPIEFRQSVSTISNIASQIAYTYAARDASTGAKEGSQLRPDGENEWHCEACDTMQDADTEAEANGICPACAATGAGKERESVDFPGHNDVVIGDEGSGAAGGKEGEG